METIGILCTITAARYITKKYGSKWEISKEETEAEKAKRSLVHKLNQEAKPLNNPSTFVEYAKLTRQANKLEKELDISAESRISRYNAFPLWLRLASSYLPPLLVPLILIFW